MSGGAGMMGAGVSTGMNLMASKAEREAMLENAAQLELKAREVMEQAEKTKERRRTEAVALKGTQQNMLGTLDEATRSIIDSESNMTALEDLLEIHKMADMESKGLQYEARQLRKQESRQKEMEPWMVVSGVLNGASAYNAGSGGGKAGKKDSGNNFKRNQNSSYAGGTPNRPIPI